MGFISACFLMLSTTQLLNDHSQWAATPPMGWNSWDCFGTSLTEAQAKAQADAMEKHLKPFGWQVFTVDIQWYEPESKGHIYNPKAKLEMDEFGRLIPAVRKFPSSANGAGFKPLADYIHAKGFKFGIHIMRGIAKQAVEAKLPIKGTNVTAADIANRNSTCAWNPDMYGVDMSKPGSQEYYDSLFELYASWGVDFIKVDDIARPYDAVQLKEVEAIRKAIDKVGRPMVLSLSPGDTPLSQGEHVSSFANQWRISDDFWDQWAPLYGMFGRLHRWTPFRKPGHWPDADMLPFGIVEFNRPTRFTQEEQLTCMSLWSVAKSPLILGADMTRMDDFTIKLLTNPEIIEVNQRSINNRQISDRDDLFIWAAEDPSGGTILGLFNAQKIDSPFQFDNAIFASPVLKGSDLTKSCKIEAQISGAKKLFLVVSDAGDNFDYDHAAWIEPKLIGAKGSLNLLEIDWNSATSGWGSVHKNRTAEGRALTFNDKPVNGIGTHSVSVIEFAIPEGYDRFEATGIMTEGSRGRGSIQFYVLTESAQRAPKHEAQIKVDLAQLGLRGKYKVRNLWDRKDEGTVESQLSRTIPSHGGRLYRLTPAF